jgi:hypothetical protein
VDELAAGEGRALLVAADVSRGEDARGVAEEAARAFGGVDVLVNNAGIQTYGTVEEMPEEEWDRTIAVNLKSVYLVSKYVVPELRRRGGPDLILVDSPAFGAGADAGVIAGWVDGVVVVVDVSRATDRALDEVLRRLEAGPAAVLGLVINRDRSVRSGSYEYYRSAGGAAAPEGERVAR